MKRSWEFLKTTIVAGLLVILPVVLVAKALGEVVHFAEKAAGPIIKLLPKQITTHPKFSVVFAVLVIILACLIAGLFMRLPIMRAIGSWVERHFLQPIPGYRAIRSLASGLSGSLKESAFKAAILTSPDGGVELVYLIEDHGNGLATIMIPSAPNPIGGAIKIVPRERIQMLNVGMSAMARVLTQWGVGAQALLRKRNQPS
jgi:uncharacterized membrane protein